MSTAWSWFVVAIVALNIFGCLLLLLRKRLAFPILLTSAIGTIVCTLGGLFLLGGLKVMSEPSDLGLTLLPVIIAAFLACYAGAMSKKGVLG